MKVLKSSKTLVVLVLLIISPARAGATEEPLTLGQALQRAVAGNLDLRRERVAIEIADANILAALGDFDFLLSANLDFRRSTEPALTAEDIVSGYTNTVSLDLGLSRRLETGGLVALTYDTTAFNTNSRIQCGVPGGLPEEKCTFYSNALNLSFAHPLLRNFGSDVTLANLRRQRIQKSVALLNRETRAANVLRDVVTSYWELAYATQDLAIRRSAVELAQEQLRITRAQIDVGRLAPADLAAVERAIAERLQDVALSEQALFFRTLDLRELLGIPAQPGQPAFKAMDAPVARPHRVNLAAEVTRALDNNPQLKALHMGLQLSELDVQTATSTLWPRLDFVAAIGARGRSRGDLPETLAQTVGLDYLTWSAGLNFQLPIQNRTARGQLRAARLGAERDRLDTTTLELAIRDTVMRLASNISTASSRVELAGKAVGFAQQNLEAERARFSVGRSTNNDVLLRQQELKNAEIQVVRATVDLLNSEAALSAITAETLDRYGVVLKGL